MEDNFEEGIFLGTIKTRSARRRPESDRWEKDLGSNIRGSPQVPVPVRGGDHIPTAVHLPVGAEEYLERGQVPVEADPEEEGNQLRPQLDQEVNQTRPLQNRKMYATGNMIKRSGMTELAQAELSLIRMCVVTGFAWN